MAGNTIRNIAVGLRIGTELLRTGSGGRHVETLCPIARPAPGSSLAGRVAISPATVAEELASATAVELA